MELNLNGACYVLLTRFLTLFGMVWACGTISCGTMGVYFAEHTHNRTETTWPTKSASGTWLGSVLMTTCIFGLTASFCPRKLSGAFLICGIFHIGGCLASTSLSSTNFTYSVTILTQWTRDVEPSDCEGHYAGVVAMASMNLMLAIITGMTSLSMFGTFFFGMHYIQTGKSPLGSFSVTKGTKKTSGRAGVSPESSASGARPSTRLTQHGARPLSATSQTALVETESNAQVDLCEGITNVDP